MTNRLLSFQKATRGSKEAGHLSSSFSIGVLKVSEVFASEVGLGLYKFGLCTTQLLNKVLREHNYWLKY
jgi:hypothetical protein